MTQAMLTATVIFEPQVQTILCRRSILIRGPNFGHARLQVSTRVGNSLLAISLLVRRTCARGINQQANERPAGSETGIHEVKHHGPRLLARRGAERVRLFTRNGHDWTERFRLIVEALNAQPALHKPP